MPRVSVVIPTYNRADYIERAIQSVLQQTYRDFEIIVCDDNSTDNTVEIVKTIRGNSQIPIKIESLPFNLGVAAARNRAIYIAKGELIGFLDSDDSWKPRKLEAQVAFLDSNPDCIGVGCGCDIVNENNGIEATFTKRPALDPSKELFELLYKCYIVTSCFLVKKEAIILAGLFDLRLKKSQDRDLWWRLPRIGRLCFLNESLVNYRKHGSSISKTMSKVTGKTYIPAIKRTIFYWEDQLTGKERRKIISQAHILVAFDAAIAGAFSVTLNHALKAILNGFHFRQAMESIMRVFKRFYKKYCCR